MLDLIQQIRWRPQIGDPTFKNPLVGTRLNWILELGGVGLIGASAVADLAKSRRHRG